jgi:hypothetical protein
MNGKRAFRAEVRAMKIIDMKADIAALYKRFTDDPFKVDYGKELEALDKKYPKDKGLLLIAEREFYQDLKKIKGPLQTNM